MKRILMVLFLVLMSSLCNAQDNKKNSISLGFGSVVSTKMASFSPVIDLNYRRNFKNGFGLNVGYRFKDCNYDKYNLDVYVDRYPRYNNPILFTNSIIVGLTYNIKLYKDFVIVPMINIGLGHSVIIKTNDPNSMITSRTTVLGRGLGASVIPSINVEYNLDRVKLFCSYDYEMLFAVEFLGFGFYSHLCILTPFTITELFLGNFKLGIAFKF